MSLVLLFGVAIQLFHPTYMPDSTNSPAVIRNKQRFTNFINLQGPNT
ncbi:MAG: hypothetical protein M1114_04140 [Candidatus Dependentiae bacterium]|nr:hypothetical protein [Candidatus Dependentiae bacterium]